MDPLDQKEYVNKAVTIETTCGSLHKGVVYTVDPISGSFLLCGMDNVEVVMGNRVRNVTVDGESVDGQSLDLMFGEPRWVGRNTDTSLLSDPSVQARKEKLVSWLAKHRIPVTDSGASLGILDALTVHPPYRVEDCVSANPIVLGRVQDLVGNMPSDFET